MFPAGILPSALEDFQAVLMSEDNSQVLPGVVFPNTSLVAWFKEGRPVFASAGYQYSLFVSSGNPSLSK